MTPEALRDQARAEVRAGRFREALALYQRAAERMGPEPDQGAIGVLHEMGDLHLRLGEQEECARVWELAIDRYLAADFPLNAVAVARKAIRSLPDRPVFLLRLAGLLSDRALFAESRVLFEGYLEARRRGGGEEAQAVAMREVARAASRDVPFLLDLCGRLASMEGEDAVVPALRKAHQEQVEGGDWVAASRIADRLREIDPRIELPEETDDGLVDDSAGVLAWSEDPEPLEAVQWESGSAEPDPATDPGWEADGSWDEVESLTGPGDPGLDDAFAGGTDLFGPDGGLSMAFDSLESFGFEDPPAAADAFGPGDPSGAGADFGLGEPSGGAAGSGLDAASGWDPEWAGGGAGVDPTDLGDALAFGDLPDFSGSFEFDPDPAYPSSPSSPNPPPGPTIDLDQLRERAIRFPTDGVALLELGRALVRVGSRDEAWFVLERAHPILSATPSGTADAEDALRLLVSIEVGGVTQQLRRVEYSFRLRDSRMAIQSLLGLGRALGSVGERTRAIATFRKVLEMDPGHREALTGLVVLGVAWPFHEPSPTPSIEPGGSPGMPVPSTAPIPSLAPAPDMPVAGAPHPTEGAGPEPRASWTDRSDRPSAADPGAWIPEGARTRWKLGEEDWAHIGDDPDPLVETFRELVLGEWPPDDPRGLVDLATAFRSMGRERDAVLLAQRALRIDPLNLPAHELLGESLLAAGHPSAAVRVLERALGLGGVPDTMLAGIHYVLGLAHSELDDPLRARDAFERTYSVDAGFRDVEARLGALR